MKKFILAAVGTLLLVASFQARAAVIIATNTIAYEGTSGGNALPSDYLYITYAVNQLSNGSYEYDYDLLTVNPEKLTSFTIGGLGDPIDTQTMAIFNYGSASVTGSGFDSNSVGWVWGFNADVTSDTLSFTSYIAPGYASFTANDDDIEWESTPLTLIPAPVPVPEPSSYALLGVAACAFCLIGLRRPAKLQTQKISK
jgi:hypothetical protein